MATFNVGAKKPIIISDSHIDALRARIAAGENPETVTREFFDRAVADMQQNAVEINAHGFTTGGLNENVLKQYGYDGSSNAHSYMSQFSSAFEPLLALLKGEPAQKQYAPGSLDPNSTNFIGSSKPDTRSRSERVSTPIPAGNYPKGTVLRRDDGVLFVADGNSNYGNSYKPTGEYSSSAPGPVTGANPIIATAGPSSSGGAILSDLSKDPSLQEHFNNVSSVPELAGLLPGLESMLEKAIESGKVVNPNIEISPVQIAQFLNQAKTELEPYYQEKLSLLRSDLDLSVKRLVDDYTKGIERAKDPFKQELETQAESEAQSGTTYSSERVDRERRLVVGQQEKLDDFTTSATRSLQDKGLSFEKEAGSNLARTLNIPGLTGFKATTGGITPGATQSTYNPLGNIALGNIGKEREVALRTRASELEENFRRNRILDLSPLS